MFMLCALLLLTAARGARRTAVFVKGPDAEYLVDIGDTAVTAETRLVTAGCDGLGPTLVENLGLATVVEYTFTVQIVGVGLPVFNKPLWECNSHRGGVNGDDMLTDQGTA